MVTVWNVISWFPFAIMYTRSLDSVLSSRQGSFKAAKDHVKKAFPGISKKTFDRRKSAARKRKDEVIAGSSVPKDLINIDVSGSKYVIELTVLNRYERAADCVLNRPAGIEKLLFAFNFSRSQLIYEVFFVDWKRYPVNI